MCLILTTRNNCSVKTLSGKFINRLASKLKKGICWTNSWKFYIRLKAVDKGFLVSLLLYLGKRSHAWPVATNRRWCRLQWPRFPASELYTIWWRSLHCKCCKWHLNGSMDPCLQTLFLEGVLVTLANEKRTQEPTSICSGDVARDERRGCGTSPQLRAGLQRARRPTACCCLFTWSPLQYWLLFLRRTLSSVLWDN